MNRSQGTRTRDRKTTGHTEDRSQETNYTKRVIEMLTDDHEAAKKLFRQGDKLADDPEQLQSIVRQACVALTQHAEIEEEFLYPALREVDGDLIAEAQVEHDSARQLIADLESMDPDDERYRATFKVLGEYVGHHIKEEQDEIFPLARESKADFEPLFEALTARMGDRNADAVGEPLTGDAEQPAKRRPGGVRPARRSSPRSGR